MAGPNEQGLLEEHRAAVEAWRASGKPMLSLLEFTRRAKRERGFRTHAEVLQAVERLNEEDFFEKSIIQAREGLEKHLESYCAERRAHLEGQIEKARERLKSRNSEVTE